MTLVIRRGYLEAHNLRARTPESGVVEMNDPRQQKMKTTSAYGRREDMLASIMTRLLTRPDLYPDDFLAGLDDGLDYRGRSLQLRIVSEHYQGA